MALRREQGLCFNCDEKFVKGHKCSSKFFIMIVDDDTNIPTDDVFNLPEPKLSCDPSLDPNSQSA